MADGKKKPDWRAGRERFEHDKREQIKIDRRNGANRLTDKQIDKRVDRETERAFNSAINKGRG